MESCREPVRRRGCDGTGLERCATVCRDGAAAGRLRRRQCCPWPMAQQRDSIDGEWAGRWSGGSAEDQWATGTATIQTVGERVYILFRQGVQAYLIDTR